MGSRVCGLPLKCVSTVIGSLFLIIAVVLIVILSWVLKALLELKEVDVGDEKSISWIALTCLQIYFGMNIFMVCGSVVLNIFLLIGICKKKSRFLLPFIVFKLFTTVCVSLGMISYSHTLRSTILLVLYSVTVFTLLAILHIYYRELKEEKNEEMSITLDTLGNNNRSSQK
ncbi:uncharacterized protein LOC111062182 [Nilaparvata lugens]|uniref:uncharacterized protein LOC111062182 n=1 Tax=Nilaparvata lugens TaxID=108931 RepID=UPI000B9928F0|nr:uncharacterized protein LOC111062182 [Nilaparvata lugens]